MRKNKKAFTLIELIAVLVILAIIALIVTPLVMNIVKKAKDSANKRSVDAYGKAVELGVATYLLDNGDYPTDINSLTIEYSGNEVVCNTKKLNEDGSIYLSGCSVNGAEVKDTKTEDGWYHYGKTSAEAYQSYSVGDVVTYNGMNFYVIENSDENSDRVTMLKAEPLTVDEVNTYGGVGTDNNHVNMYATSDTTALYYQTSYDENGYGYMAYYTSETCGDTGSEYVLNGCKTNYEDSDIKFVVDAWTDDKLNQIDLKEDRIGYKTRLITFEDLTNNLGYENKNSGTINSSSNGNTPSWVYNSNYDYWTMSAWADYTYKVLNIDITGNIHDHHGFVYDCSYGAVRPVITLSKDAI